MQGGYVRADGCLGRGGGWNAEMEMLLPRVLVTLATLAYAAGPFVVDMNRTHLRHPAWPGHARLHLLWAAVGQLGVGLAGLGWMWWGAGDPVWQVRVVAVVGLLFTGGFWVALALRRFYGGTLHDPQGVPPWRGIDGNLIAVGVIDAMLVAALLLV